MNQAYQFVWDLKTGVIYISGAVHERYPLRGSSAQGYPMEEWERIVYENDLPALREERFRLLGGDRAVHSMRYRLRDRTGALVWVSSQGSCMLDQEQQPAMVMGSIQEEEPSAGETCGAESREGESCEGDPRGEAVRTPADILAEELEEIVYISDPDSYELYYLNPAGCSRIGIHDYRGKACYQVLQGRPAPCEFCNNKRLTTEEFLVWEMDNIYLKRQFIIKDKLIPWNGGKARLEIARDITEQEIVSRGIQEKLDFEKNIVNCTRILVEESDMDTAVSRVLQSIGEFYQADRAYIFERTSLGGWDNTYEWCQHGTRPMQPEMQNVSYDFMKQWQEVFEQDRSVVIADAQTVHEQFPGAWQVLASQGIDRLIAAPIWKRHKLIGFLGVDNPRAHQEDDAQIHTMACFLAERVNRNETEARLNDLLVCHYEDILKVTDLGLWVIRINKEENRYEMFADSTMCRIMDLKGSVTPEECYFHWYDRINDGYYQYVNASVESMIQTRHIVQLEYTWNHPSQGEVTVRCLGIRVEDQNGMICLQGYHRIISDMDKPRFLPDADRGEMFEYNERKKSIYFHSGRNLLAGTKEREEDFPESWIRRDMVHPHFAEEFREIFRQVETQEEINGQEVLLKTKNGLYEWFRISTRHLGREQKDAQTIVVMLDPVGVERSTELEFARISDFYNAMLSETVAYAEVDVESGQLMKSDGLWVTYAGEARRQGITFTELVEQYMEKVVEPEDVDTYRSYLDLENMKMHYQRGEATQKWSFRRRSGDGMRWMELVVHIFQERFMDNMYALLYLKDIDVEKRRQLANEVEANRDPLTNVYNRRVFEREVTRYMTQEEHARGALIVLDLDNFKQINDQYGHLAGDQALKQLTEVLLATFRRRDIVGRLGGDEFLVFLKQVDDQSILDRRMYELFTSLREQKSEAALTCSVGIRFVQAEGFSYERSLKEADEALYLSKQSGKNTYRYYEECAIIAPL